MTATSARTDGILYIVATPIGNRDDLSIRARQTLESVDIILAEDTRHSLLLLQHLGIKKPMVSLHAHNEEEKSEQIIQNLLQGKQYALISDAGTPLISDPGFPLVRLAHKHQIPVVPIPGACALITALCASGVASDTFTFVGFLPAKSSARLHKLESLKYIPHTLVLYESTHRILDCLDDIETVFGQDCELVLAKELTKTFERFIHGNCVKIREWLCQDVAHCKGEFVLILPPRQISSTQDDDVHILKILLHELPVKQAVKIASQLTDTSKNELYTMALTLQKSKT